MKNKLKGFTLVELIVVMVIMSLLMAGIMQLFKPMRTVYVDSTQYEAQRTAQNGVVTYITESTRFATDMGIYDTKKGVSSASAAVEELAKQYCINNNITDAVGVPVAPYDGTEVAAIKNEIKKYADVIIIDNTNKHNYNGKDYTGRLLRRKFPATPSSSVPTDPTITGSKATNDWRIAMGEAYYGANTFSINVTVTDTTPSPDGVSDDGMLNISVSSSRNGKRDISNAGIDTTVTTPSVTKGAVLCRNLAGAGKDGVNSAGVFDVSKYSGSSASSGQKTYIVFLSNDKKDSTGKGGRDKVDAVAKAAAATP